MKLRYLFFLAFLGSASFAQAQFTERIGSAQPGNTPGAGTVGKRMLQFQQGYSYSEGDFKESFITFNQNDLSKAYTLIGLKEHVQTNVIRYGILKRLEGRLRVNYKNSKIKVKDDDGTFPSTNGIDFDLGLRANVIHLPSFGFDLAVQADAGLVYGDIDSNYSEIQSSFFILASQRIAKNFVLTFNAGYQPNETSLDVIVARASLRYFYKKYLFHLGYNYNNAISEQSNLNLRSNGYFLALAYYLNNDVLLNVEASYQQEEWFPFGSINDLQTFNIGLGISWRLNFKN